MCQRSARRCRALACGAAAGARFSGAWGMVGGGCVRAMSGCRALGSFDAAFAVGSHRDQRCARPDSSDCLGLEGIVARFAPWAFTPPAGGAENVAADGFILGDVLYWAAHGQCSETLVGVGMNWIKASSSASTSAVTSSPRPPSTEAVRGFISATNSRMRSNDSNEI